MDFRIERQITVRNDCVVAKSSFCAVIYTFNQVQGMQFCLDIIQM